MNDRENRKHGDWLRLQKFMLIIAASVVFFILAAAQINTYSTHLNTEESIIFFLLVGYVLYGAHWYRMKYKGRHCKDILSNQKLILQILIIISASIVLRIYLISNLSVTQISDYMTYYTTAQEIFTSHSINPNSVAYFSAISATAPFISGLLSIPFHLFGISVKVVLYFNAFLYSTSAAGLFLISRKFISNGLAFFASLLFSVWPNHVFSSLYILSEPLYLFFLIWGITILIYATEQRNIIYKTALYALSAVLLCMSQNIRPVTVIYLIAMTLLLLTKNKAIIKKALPMITVFLTSYCAVSVCINAYTESYLSIVSKPSFGWTLFEGTNSYTWGQWSPETSEILTNVINNYPLEEVENELLNRAIQRLKEYDFNDIVELISRKVERMWARDNGYISDLKYLFAHTPEMVESGGLPHGMEQLGLLAQPVFILLAFGVMWTMLLTIKRAVKYSSENGDCPFVLILSLCGGMMLHCLATSIQRYNYIWIHMMILIFFYGIEIWSEEKEEQNVLQ